MALVLQRSPFTFALGLGAPSDLPHVTPLRVGLHSLVAKAKLITLLPTLLTHYQSLCHSCLMGMVVPVPVLGFFLSGLSTLREEILTSAFLFFFSNKFALIIWKTRSKSIGEHTFSNYNLDSRMRVAFFLQQPLWFALMWKYRVYHLCLPPSLLLPSPGSLRFSLRIFFLSLPVHIPASLFFILQLKLVLRWALKLFWCSACCGNKLSPTPSRTACVLLMEYVVCVCMRFWYKKDCGLQERPGRCSKRGGVFIESSSRNSPRSCFRSVTSWLPTVCADYTDFSKAYILCSSLHVRINKDTWE